MKDLSDKANRAIFSLNSHHKLNKLPLNITFKLFETMIMPKLLYGSEVWGAYEYNPAKKSGESRGKLTIKAVQMHFIKRLIGVTKVHIPNSGGAILPITPLDFQGKIIFFLYFCHPTLLKINLR